MSMSIQMRDRDIRLHGLDRSDRTYTLYYDETNNHRLVRIAEDGLNVPAAKCFVLGGIALYGPLRDGGILGAAGVAAASTQRPGTQARASGQRRHPAIARQHEGRGSSCNGSSKKASSCTFKLSIRSIGRSSTHRGLHRRRGLPY